MDSTRTRSVTYWACTGVVSLQFLVGGVSSLARPPVVLEGLAHLGYPSYFALILGTWKVLGAATLLLPRLARLKEWAYAGFVFDLTSAAMSYAAVGEGAHAIGPLACLVFTMTSWLLRPKSRVLGTLGSLPRLSRAELGVAPAHATHAP